jgi:glycosyltransferase involved in cell wall biosynthesis
MDFEKKISLIVGLKNNLDYTQSFYKRLRELYKEVEVVFVSYGSTDGTHEWLDSLNDKNLKYYYSEESKSLSHTYNKGVEISTSELISYLHNDIIIGKGFLEELVKSWQKDAVLFYSLVEPPIFADDKR